MANISKLIVFQEARQLIRMVHQISKGQGFADLNNQLQRAALSVASNIAEGAGSGSDRQFKRYLAIARASANEAQAQLTILTDLEKLDQEHPAIELATRIGKRLTRFIKRLEPG